MVTPKSFIVDMYTDKFLLMGLFIWFQSILILNSGGSLNLINAPSIM